MSCLRMRSCCGCLDTAKGTVLAAVASIAACIVTFGFIVVGLVYWSAVSESIRQKYNNTGIPENVVEWWVDLSWWGNIFTFIFLVVYILLCVLMMVGVRKEQFKHMIPWISLTTMLIPFVVVCSIIQLVVGLIGNEPGVYIPVIIVLVWCCFWTYGFFCSVSHYRMLKGDIHRPVATLFKRDDDRRR